MLQALPYVALLIVMLFFIYAVIGMQVTAIWDYYITAAKKNFGRGGHNFLKELDLSLPNIFFQ